MSGETLNIAQPPRARMALAPPIPAPSSPLALSEPFRQHLVDELHLANLHLHELARTARSGMPPRAELERAITAAWVGLATIERAAGLGAIVSKASTARRILVVDDSADMRFLIARTLKTIAPGAAIETARDATQALALLGDAGPGDGITVISDYDMGPGPTGVELLAVIASDTRDPTASSSPATRPSASSGSRWKPTRSSRRTRRTPSDAISARHDPRRRRRGRT